MFWFVIIKEMVIEYSKFSKSNWPYNPFDMEYSMGLVTHRTSFDEFESGLLKLLIVQEENISLCLHEFTRIKVST